jgi:catechol 2,3-dioxygenase-like lactoylglutathione lyase family enzyme
VAVTYGFDHVHLNAPDVESTAAFYERVFGMRRIRTFEANGITFVHLDAWGVRVTITSRAPRASGRGNAVDHFALHVPDLHAAIADLRAKGVEILSDYAVTGEYANIFIQAPDGVAVEILSPATE